MNDLPEWLQSLIAPTDSRLRPDQRCLEMGKLEEAECLKQQLEKKQREFRERMEDAKQNWEPRWFTLAAASKDDPEGAWRIKDPASYWESRRRREWPPAPSLW